MLEILRCGKESCTSTARRKAPGLTEMLRGQAEPGRALGLLAAHTAAQKPSADLVSSPSEERVSLLSPNAPPPKGVCRGVKSVRQARLPRTSGDLIWKWDFCRWSQLRMGCKSDVSGSLQEDRGDRNSIRVMQAEGHPECQRHQAASSSGSWDRPWDSTAPCPDSKLLAFRLGESPLLLL